MAKAVSIRKGSAAEHAGFIGWLGELSYNTTTKGLHTHDGETPGGFALAPQAAFAGRAEAEAARPAPFLWRIAVRRGHVTLAYVRDPAGTALMTADGTRWSPDGWQSPLHWGGLCDGATDDADAWEALALWVNARGQAHIVLTSISLCTRPIVLTVTDLRIDCAPGTGGLYFPDSDGIRLTQNRRYAGFVTNHLLLITGAEKTRTAWRYQNTAPATGDTAPREHNRLTTIGRDRWLAGRGGPALPQYPHGWLYDCDLLNADRVKFDTPWLQGAERDRHDGYPIESVGIRADGTTLALPCVVDAGGNTRVGFNTGDRDWRGTALASQIWSRTDPILFQLGVSRNVNFVVTNGAGTVVNRLGVLGAAAGFAPILRAEGADADIDLRLEPKGGGKLVLGAALTAASGPAITGYLEVKLTNGATVKLGVID